MFLYEPVLRIRAVLVQRTMWLLAHSSFGCGGVGCNLVIGAGALLSRRCAGRHHYVNAGRPYGFQSACAEKGLRVGECRIIVVERLLQHSTPSRCHAMFRVTLLRHCSHLHK